MRRRNSSRGFTLIEVLVALAILCVGGLGTLQLLGLLSKSNGNVNAETEAMQMARELRSEIENVSLLRTQLGPPTWPVGAPITASTNVAIDGNKIGPNVVGPNGGRYSVQYQLANWTPPVGQGPDRNNDGVVDVAGLDITITVDNVLALAVPTRSDMRLLRPVILTFRKDVQESASIASGGVERW